MEKIAAVVKIIRPVNFLIVLLTVIVSSVVCVKNDFSPAVVAAASLSAGFAAAAGNVINDLFDIEIDKLNRPSRPLPSKKISGSEAVALYLLLAALSLFLGYLVSAAAFIITLIADAVLFIYSFKLKSVPLLGNAVIALLTGLAFLYGGIAVNNISYAYVPAVFAFLINFIREIVKDMEDIKGDITNNIRTFPLLKGYRSSKNLILTLVIILIAATFYPYAAKLYKIEYFFIVMLTVNPLLIYSMKKLFEDHSGKNLNKVSKLLKLNMILGLTAIYFGK